MWRRLSVLAITAAAVVALDQSVKWIVPTEPRLYHERSGAWFALSVAVLAGTALLALLPSRGVPVAAGVVAGGVVGNLVSATLGHGLVENPLVIDLRGGGIAFNVADVAFVLGIVLLTAALMEVAVRHRHLLPQSTIPVRLARRFRARRAARRSRAASSGR